MKKFIAMLGLSALAVVAALPAVAKTDAKAPPAAKKDPAPGAKKEPAQPRWEHTFADAIEEAKERNCVVFATFHSEH